MFTTSAERVVALSYDDGMYYSLDQVGGRVWELAVERLAAGNIIDRICAEYNGPRVVIEQDVLRLLADLVERRLLRVAS